jgi:ectoine hydroxylase
MVGDQHGPHTGCSVRSVRNGARLAGRARQRLVQLRCALPRDRDRQRGGNSYACSATPRPPVGPEPEQHSPEAPPGSSSWAPAGLWPRLAPHPRVLTEAQRRFYWQEGYLRLEGVVSATWVERLRAAMRRQVAALSMQPRSPSRRKWFVFEQQHTDAAPRLVRLVAPDRIDEFWAFTCGPAADIAADLLGDAGLRFHHSKLNFKWAHGGDPASWHQDAQFWPHSNFGMLTVGLYLHDVPDEESGPLTVLPLSAHERLHALEDAEGHWTAVLSRETLRTLPLHRAVALTGRAGTITVHNCVRAERSACVADSVHAPLILDIIYYRYVDQYADQY